MSSLVTTTGLNWMLNSTFGTTTEVDPALWEVGLSSTAPSLTDTSCTSRVPYEYTILDSCEAANWTQEGDGANEVVNSTDYITGAACLDIRATLAGGTAGWYKTVGAVDFTTGSKCLYVFFYVSNLSLLTDSASAVIITLGTGGFVNYNDYYFARSSLTAGAWQVLRLPYATLAVPSATGGAGATLTNVDRIKITLRDAQTWSGTEVRMDAWHYATDAQHEKVCEAGYPVVNTTQNTVTWRVKYDTSQADGYYLVRGFFKNTTDMGFNSFTYSQVSKDSSKELFITTIMKIRNVT